MPSETNETDPRGTRAKPRLTFGKATAKRLLRTVLLIVWVIDKAFRLFAWLIGGAEG